MTSEGLAGGTASTSKILQFPARGRFAASVEQVKTETFSEAAYDSWYHDVAIKDSKRAHDR
jgi:hypothetical protein